MNAPISLTYQSISAFPSLQHPPLHLNLLPNKSCPPHSSSSVCIFFCPRTLISPFLSRPLPEERCFDTSVYLRTSQRVFLITPHQCVLNTLTFSYSLTILFF